jgi:hypothetical protein
MEFLRKAPAVVEELLSASAHELGLPFVFGADDAEQRADGGVGEEVSVARGGFAEHFADLKAPVAAHHGSVAAPASERSSGAEPSEVAEQAVAKQVFVVLAHGSVIQRRALYSNPRNSRM